MKALEQHRITSFIASAVESQEIGDCVPDGVRSRLTHAYRETLLTNTVNLRMTAIVIQALRDRSVDPVLWKGIVLADSLYPDPAARWMGDIDFAIGAEEKERATDAFRSVGLEPFESTPDAICFSGR